MKAILKAVLIFVVVGLALVSVESAKAQCAQCAATVATNAKSGDTTTNGLNKGILFLLAAPYVAVGIGGYVWYRKYRRKNVMIAMQSEKLHLN
jgi:hypothetical protein